MALSVQDPLIISVSLFIIILNVKVIFGTMVHVFVSRAAVSPSETLLAVSCLHVTWGSQDHRGQ